MKNPNKKYLKNRNIEKTVKIGNNVKIYPNVFLFGSTEISDGVTIFPNTIIIDSYIGKNVKIMSSCIERSVVCEDVQIGPFAHLRPNSKIGKNCKIGNFVEIKNSILGNNVKVSHMAYVGDAEVGDGCNISCGVIFSNFNGKTKNKITIGKNCFIGSNSNLIAPLTIERDTFICAGSTLTKNTNCGDFVIARSREIIKPKRAYEYLN